MPAPGTAGARRPPGGRPGTGRRPTVRRIAAGRRQVPGRAPFVVLTVVLLAAGLVGLLMLNTALNQGSFQLRKLQDETTRLTDEQQSLEQQIDQWSAPDALQRRARELGMVPGGNPAFLQDDGKVLGRPEQAGTTASAAQSLPQPAPQSAAAAPSSGAAVEIGAPDSGAPAGSRPPTGGGAR